MKAYHIKKIKHTGGAQAAARGRRAVSLLLCLCMVLSVLSQFGGVVLPTTAAAEQTVSALNRIADGDTSDTYEGKLLSDEWGSRYAGRVWTDKSVFAYTADKSNAITLDMETDGYIGNVGFNADFAHVFSALASSQELMGVPPVRTVIVFDNSGSMYNSSKATADSGEELWQKQRIAITIEAINRAIDILMEASVYNEVAVVLFGDGAQADCTDNTTTSTHPYYGNNTAVTILPMKHYTPNIPEGAEYTPYLTGGWNNSSKTEDERFNGATPCHQGTGAGGKSGAIEGGWVFVNNEICGLKGMNWNDCGDLDYTAYANGTTNIQAGYYVGMQELMNAKKTVKVGNDTYKCIPSLVMLTDGAATDKMSGDFITPDLKEVNGVKSQYPTDIAFVNDTGNKLRSFTGYDTTTGNKEIHNFWDMFVETDEDGFYKSVVPSDGYDKENGSHRPTGDGLKAMKKVADTYNDSVASMLLGTLMTTAYYKAAVKKAYGIADDKSWAIYSLSVDMVDINKVPADAAQDAIAAASNEDPKAELPKSWQYNITSNAPTMDPSNFFYKNGEFSLDWLIDRGYIDSTYTDKEGNVIDIEMSDLLNEPDLVLEHTAYPDYSVGEMIIHGIVKAGSYLKEWEKGNEVKTSFQGWSEVKGILKDDAANWGNNEKVKAFSHSNGYLLGEEHSINWAQIPDDDVNKVEKQDVLDNIAYNTSAFYASTADDAAENLAGTFQEIIVAIMEPLFVPVSGENATGVADSVTYQDPLGEYMELKHNAITITEGEVAGTTDKTFDMAALLFGEMHGLVRAGVYDYQWNDKYMLAHPDVGTHGQTRFPMGWYKGDPEDAYQPKETAKDESGSWPAKDPVTGATYENAEEAWADGWVMRFDFQTMLSFVPIANAPESGLPENLDESVKNTVYTCYRFADSQAERNKLRRNPIFGEVPETLEQEWEAYYEQYGSYPVGMGKYSSTSGVYRLSDIRVWAEHTGDFIDESGAITPEDQSGYDDALYVNIPVVAVPTQLAEITIGAEGAISYKDNLNEKTQSTPFRVFYAVGLTEDLIQRDSDGNQTGVDVSKISGEYIASHSDPTTGNIYFISNWYSNTAYRGYTSDEAEASRTRGDAVVTFSPNVANRYYLFQKPLPLIAHAYRVQNDAGDVAPVDNDGSKAWGANGSGNGSSTWEDGQVGGATWSGGEFIGTYENEEAFKAALQAKTKGDDDVFYIEDAKGYSYPLPPDITNAIITYTKDQLSNVDSDGDGYADNANSFSSNDYFFLCVEYYMPMAGYGKDIHNREDPSTRAVCKVYRMIARKGSAFGSGLQSEHIGNGDMLCWHDIKGNCTQEIAYNSRTDTGDITRGRPTLEKLTKTGSDLRTYLSEKCGISEGYLDQECAKWTALQGDAHMQSLINQIKGAPDQQAMFDELFDWSVSAKTHGIRVGDMFNNMQAKSGDLVGGYYTGNVTQTANNYYIPTLSEKSTAGDGLIINNYLGNNGRLEVANDTLMVTKTLVAPEGFNLTDKQQNEKFQYQVYVQGLTGERSAQRLKWNPFSQSWQRRVETLDILTDNSSLLLDNNGSRALFCFKGGKLQQVVAVIDNETGLATYFYANPDGSATTEKCDHTDELYCIYLPDHDGDLTYRLFASDYDTGTEVISGVGTTAYYPHGMDTKMLPEADHDSQTFAEEITDKGDGSMDNRPAGSREYWTEEAELIPYAEIMAAEADDGSLDTVGGNGDIALMALTAEGNHWEYNPPEPDGYQTAGRLTLVTVIPSADSTDSTVYSPFSSRTQYMTVPLYFGYTGELAAHLAETGETLATCPDLERYRLAGSMLYDQTVPDRPDLFRLTTSSDRIAQNTARFTLKSGEGLLLTGLGNGITYRFTEGLTAGQVAEGYTLKEVNHIQEPPDDEPDTHDGSGVYSVFGDTDHVTEQTHYTNTIDPELFVLTKELVDAEGNPVVTPPEQEFTFTLTFTPDAGAAMTDMDDVLHYWKGDKNGWTSTESWTDESSGATYQMPEHAPPLDGYEKYLTDGDTRLKPIRPDEGKTDRTYTVKLKANEAIVFYGLIAGTTYSVTETADEHYPIVPEADGYTKSGTINRASVSKDEISPETTHNRADFKNLLQGGILTVEKNILDDNRWALTDDFGFTVVLSAEEGIPLSAERLSVTKVTTKEDGSESSEELPTTAWTTETAAGETRLTATFRLKHGERFVISGIPLGTKYTVKESDRNGYNLEYVVDVIETPDTSNSENFIHPEDFTTEGDITEKQPQAYWLFVNAKPPVLAFTGGAGVGLFYVLGAVCLLVSGLALLRLYRKRRAE